MASFTMYRNGDSVYIVRAGESETWAQAEAFAQSLDEVGSWHLVSINTAAEAGWLTTVLPGTRASWIGLVQSDDSVGVADGWSWLDGTEATYVQWSPPEPNDWLGPGSEQIAEVYASGLWNDAADTDTNTTSILETSALTGLKLQGSDGDDLMRGGNGNDRFNGLGGDDTMNGGLGRDTLIGGGGSNVYRPETLDDSTPGALDRILKFGTEDAFDFTALTALASFDGADSFAGVAGEIIVKNKTLPSGPQTLVLIDVDGDGIADSGYRLIGDFELTAANFL